ncbi:uroporphyrinogen-III synthase [Hydrogenobacter hydrogenophilus]|uniref:Uroporphyrinogen-III synthase n=1 Tax=Hydrogenobacter hydrogenophilus TaxID=35835 RepID=A0A285P1B1_9AQUI|nr:uroporphyrinogen-III synthase [Hydrogenobacter hydrogenophilus]SNZ13661.1 uroporphyrinogen-III synthase [Hydrogenobacter hydrogenophilus]
MHKVILTRSPEDIERDRKLFEREGLGVIALPLIKTLPIDFEPIDENFDFVIFQSAKAVKYFFERAKLRGNEKIIVVGEAVKKAVESYGYSVYQIPEMYYAQEIKLLMEKEKRGTVLLPRSREGREELIKWLSDMGFTVYPLNVYATEYVLYDREDFLKRLSMGQFVFFASPSAVRSFFANLPKPEGTKLLKKKKIVCIGKTTKEELTSLSGLSCFLPEKQSVESVVSLIKSLVSSLH